MILDFKGFRCLQGRVIHGFELSGNLYKTGTFREYSLEETEHSRHCYVTGAQNALLNNNVCNTLSMDMLPDSVTRQCQLPMLPNNVH